MHNVVGVRYSSGCKIYNFDAGENELRVGDTVLVDSEQGLGVAIVVTAVRKEERSEEDKPLKKVIRKASGDDLSRIEMSKEKEAEAFRVCQKKILEREMVMKLVRVEWAFDNSKATFYFTADGRVDFRDLVRDLAHRFKIRIEMRQIGVRDEAKMIGGFGPCGRELCCASFLREFEPVSIKMAKKQDLVLNPAKISGTCGRLMCCLGYEYSFYDDIKRSEMARAAAKAAAKTARPEEEEAEAVPSDSGAAQDKSRRKRSAWRKKRGKPKDESREQPAKQAAEAAPRPESGQGQPSGKPRKRGRRSGRGRGRGGEGGPPKGGPPKGSPGGQGGTPEGGGG